MNIEMDNGCFKVKCIPKKKISERGKLNANMQIESDLQSFGSHNYFSTKE